MSRLLEYHESVEAWFYLGPLEAGKKVSLADYPDVTEGWRTHINGQRYYHVESGMAFGDGPTPEIAWRYYLGAEAGPDDEGFDEAAYANQLGEAQP